MRKIFVYVLILFFAGNLAFADGDLWDNFGDQNTYGQKAVSDQDFQKALDSKKGRNR